MVKKAVPAQAGFGYTESSACVLDSRAGQPALSRQAVPAAR